MYKDCFDYQYQTKGWKKRKLIELTIEEKLEVYEAIKIKMEYHQDVADRFKISRETIKTLLKQMKKDPSHLRKNYEK